MLFRLYFEAAPKGIWSIKKKSTWWVPATTYVCIIKNFGNVAWWERLPATRGTISRFFTSTTLRSFVSRAALFLSYGPPPSTFGSIGYFNVIVSLSKLFKISSFLLAISNNCCWILSTCNDTSMMFFSIASRLLNQSFYSSHYRFSERFLKI